MKNVRLIRKDESAVSPVIATILMVAITVVLAAVLYVMVSVSGATYTVTWTDPGGERQLNGGDGFQTVKTSGNLASQTLFTFYLLYLDGTTIQTKEFRTI